MVNEPAALQGPRVVLLITKKVEKPSSAQRICHLIGNQTELICIFVCLSQLFTLTFVTRFQCLLTQLSQDGVTRVVFVLPSA